MLGRPCDELRDDLDVLMWMANGRPMPCFREGSMFHMWKYFGNSGSDEPEVRRAGPAISYKRGAGKLTERG